MDQQPILQLVVAYTFVGALVFTVVLTCLSLVGWITFKDEKQQKKLFSVFLIELVVGSLAWFFQFIALDPGAVAKEIERKAVSVLEKRTREDIAKMVKDKEAEYSRQVKQLQADADQTAKGLATALSEAQSKSALLQVQVNSAELKLAQTASVRSAATAAEARKPDDDQAGALGREKKTSIAKVDPNACLALPVPEAVIGPLVVRE